MTEELSEGSMNLCNDPETEGFDLHAGQSWIYPTNYSVREYQYNITEQALFKNTLVSLPTGLGKTFIAAVVMYNFFRWYPLGKIIFMAPTKPLVKQQVDACYNVMAIPPSVTAELTGTKVSSVRTDIWKEKRVFFITPQVLQNDLDRVLELGSKIKCIVFDEAHKAKGNQAYCEVIRKLVKINKYFRVLALSATPGNNLNDMSDIMKNLLISHTEIRSDESPDVKPYVFERSLETVVVPLGDKLQEVREEYIQILEHYTRTLVKYKIINGNCTTLTKGKIFMTMKDFQQRNKGAGYSNYGEIMKSLNICVTLYHAFELLVRHGLRSFLSFFDEHIEKPLLRGDARLIRIMEDVRMYLGPAPNIEVLPDGSYPELPSNIKFGHPKFYKLRDILVEHFTEENKSSKVIVFFEYRESVMEAYALLLQARPAVKPRIFLGQGSGVTQRVQINVVKSFREGDCNTLLSTCIGEEGLDVGDVNLIVCFDISNKSPIRMIQRMGRTGRKREGQVIIFVTEGKEQQTLKDCLMYKQSLTNNTFIAKELNKHVSFDSPRLVPSDISPKCEKMYITVKEPTLTKKSTLKDMFRSISSTSSEPLFSLDLEIVEITERIPSTTFLWKLGNPVEVDPDVITRQIYNIEKQRNLQTTYKINHSKESEVLVSLLQFADSRRFNIPLSQVPNVASQCTQNKFLKQSDIRNMFMKSSSSEFSSSSQETKTPNSQNKQEEILNFNNDILINYSDLFLEVSSFLYIQQSQDKKCKFCSGFTNCMEHLLPSQDINLNSWQQPESSIFDGINNEDLNYFCESLSPQSKQQYNNLEFDLDGIDDVSDSISSISSPACKEKQNSSQIKRCEEKSFSYEAPKTLLNLLDKYNKSIINEPEYTLKTQNTTKKSHLPDNDGEKVEENDMSSILFNDSVFDAIESKHLANLESSVHTTNIDEVLTFFKLMSLDHLFLPETDKDLDETIIYSQNEFPQSPILNKTQFDYSRSPSLISGSCGKNNSNSNSPRLSANGSFQRLKDKARKRLISRTDNFKESQKKENEIVVVGNELISTENRPPEISACFRTPLKFSNFGDKLTSTPKDFLSHEIAKPDDKQINHHTLNTNLTKVNHGSDELPDNDIFDICDISVFGLNNETITKGTGNKDKSVLQEHTGEINIDDLCDITQFGLSTEAINIKVCDDFKISPTRKQEVQNISFKENSPKIKDYNDLPTKIPENVIDLTEFSSPEEAVKPSKTQKLEETQYSVTQLLNLIDKKKEDTKSSSNSSQKENMFKENVTILSDDDYEEFNFSFNNKSLLSERKGHGNKSIYNKSNILSSMKMMQTTPDINKSVSLQKKPNISNATFQVKNFHNTSVSSQKKSSTFMAIPQSVEEKLNISTSDEEFEQKPGTPHFKKLTGTKAIQPSSITSRKNVNAKLASRQIKFNEFIDDEASLAEDENVFISDDEDVDSDTYEASFIADSQPSNTTQMHCNYLQSIRSPLGGQGKFKIPSRPACNVSNIFSQAVDNEDDTYLTDSFCVNTEDIELTHEHELSELDILEHKLKQRNRKKKRKKSEEYANVKRRRIIQFESDSE